ncbi:MAG: GDP-mannose 4,6-dehydratase [Candidatus Omnitrophica bacterium]|nr:GDP-mannose 4,6-dehydratase [Candidatus Omnitrophota bacterium]
MTEKNIRKALITGAAGSGGSYLAEYIVKHQPQVEVHGIVRWHSTTSLNNLSAIKDKIKLHDCDLNDFGAVFSVIRNVKPDGVFHLASHANVRSSFDNPQAVLSNNILGTCNLFEAIRLGGIDPMIQLCSTSEVYGQVDPKNVPIREDCPLRPLSPYAVSKAAQDLLGFTYFRSYNMKIIRTRMFAYINPRRDDLFATSFAKQIARIEAGLEKELLHGNLDSVRTMIDVRDAMEAYWVAVIRCKPGEAYNIGGNRSLTVGEFLELLKKQSRVPVKSRVDPALLRPSDVTLQIPCVDKFTKETGWKPKHKFEDSVKHLLEYWRERIAKERK